MCTLQEKAYKTAIFHVFLSILALLILTLCFLNRAIDQSPHQVNCNSDIIKSSLPGVHQISCLINKLNNIIQGKINIFENISYKTAISSGLILLVLLIDLSLNVLLLKGVSKRRNILFVPWLIGQGIRILTCVTTICLTASLYIFDLSSSARNAENNANDIETTPRNRTYNLQNKTRFFAAIECAFNIFNIILF